MSLFPFPEPADRKLDTIETQARIIEMVRVIRTFATEVTDLPRSDDLVWIFAGTVISDGSWRAWQEPDKPTVPPVFRVLGLADLMDELTQDTPPTTTEEPHHPCSTPTPQATSSPSDSETRRSE